MFRGCPLTRLERWYSTMNHKTSDELDIGFECEHEYKFLVEIRIFLLLAIILKLFQVILS
jgi:hypothetical protein